MIVAFLPIIALVLLAASTGRRRGAVGVALMRSSPTAAGRITSPYGPRNGRQHQGIDIAAPRGTPVLAAMPGIVVDVSPDGTRTNYGNTVIVQHQDGTATLYGHLDSFNSRHAWVGDVVRAGDKLGAVGTTQAPLPPGRAPHLHFEVHAEVVRDRNGHIIVNPDVPRRIDPATWLRS